ncbi:MAG: TrkA family potassium uptake protein [Eubacteriales bacterium]|jgi:trk system potassium uptake protein TrkA
MKSILLIGLGRFGGNIAKKLHELDDEVLAIDKNEQRVNDVMDIVTNAQIGDTTDKRFLSELGVRDFDCCIVAIGDHFQDSVITTSLLKELGAQRIVARASSAIHESFLKKIGADEVVYPEKQVASWTAIRCSMDHILDYIAVSTDHAIYEIEVPKNWIGKSIAALDVRRKFGINILAVRENGEISMRVTPDTVLESGMSLLVFGENKSVMKCLK